MQHFAFGVRLFQGQAVLVQKSAEQGAVEQTECCARLFGPEPFGFAGDVIGQCLRRQFQTEQLLRRDLPASCRQADTFAKGL